MWIGIREFLLRCVTSTVISSHTLFYDAGLLKMLAHESLTFSSPKNRSHSSTDRVRLAILHARAVHDSGLASQSMTVPSSLPAAKSDPSALNSTLLIPPSWSVK